MFFACATNGDSLAGILPVYSSPQKSSQPLSQSQTMMLVSIRPWNLGHEDHNSALVIPDWQSLLGGSEGLLSFLIEATLFIRLA
jgi:hypothetical protein